MVFHRQGEIDLFAFLGSQIVEGGVFALIILDGMQMFLQVNREQIFKADPLVAFDHPGVVIIHLRLLQQ